MNKVANSYKEAWDLQEMQEGKSHGWIQWKGTNVCMDFHCKCGFTSHIDDEFCYHIKCPKCEKTYMCNGHIELIECDYKVTSPAICVPTIPTE